MTLRTRPSARYQRVGDGEHSEVFRRPGSRWCIQLFTVDCPELTVSKVSDEYHYLRQVYAALPELLPTQRLFVPHPAAHISETLLVKQWVDVDTTRPLNRTRPTDLPPAGVDDLLQFIRITRGLLDRAVSEPTLLPDIIDTRFQNLAVNTGGRLRLLDTNRLINTVALRTLPPGQTLDPDRRPIHARLLRRLMYLQAHFAGATRRNLADDPVYRRYLSPAALHRLFDESTADGEPI
ncbi:hypothetical protein [Frankia sp. CiP3]|uniref:hypothetical protein n=1 Tax=Frankia sp. CiP3 TaxID=2880971 RepID=UPI001EF5734A|nr:hypothetical protein [Frankia sp. CiP3]